MLKTKQFTPLLPSNPETSTGGVSMSNNDVLITTNSKSATVGTSNAQQANENSSSSLQATLPVQAKTKEFNTKMPKDNVEFRAAMEELESIATLLLRKMLKSSQKKTKSTILKVGNMEMVSLAILQASLSASCEDMVFKPIVPAPFEPGILINALPPLQLQDSSNSYNSNPNLFYNGLSDTGGNGKNDFVNDPFNPPQQSNQENEFEKEVFMPPIPLDVLNQPIQEEQYDNERTESILPSLLLKTDGIPSSERQKKPPDVLVKGQSQCAQETHYNPNTNSIVCGMKNCKAPSNLSNCNEDAGSNFKFTVDELVSIQDGYKSNGMLGPLSSTLLSSRNTLRPSDPRVDNLLLPIEATTHPPKTLLASDNCTQIILLDAQTNVQGFGTAVEVEHKTEID